MYAINLIIMDDHEIFRTGLRDILKRIDTDFNVIADATNGKEIVDLVVREQPDIILMDVEMPVMNGIEATNKIVQQFPKIGIIALSMSNERHTICEYGSSRCKRLFT